MPENEPSGAQKMFGEFAPGLVHFTDDVLFAEAWTRPELSPRDRSLVTVASLLTGTRDSLVNRGEPGVTGATGR
ncbi:MAG TPA: hypothetical protein VME22_13700 [Solirubrobacteraceae bacterium]|nr:hypothetical protein [Solirubrobacteraceae bacterium]